MSMQNREFPIKLLGLDFKWGEGTSFQKKRPTIEPKIVFALH